jgi:hypothetical protein
MVACRLAPMPTIDWSNATVQGAWLAAVIALTGVVVAAIAGFLGAIFGARVGAGAARHAADVAREQAEKDRADAAEARREAADAERSARFRDQKRELLTELYVTCDKRKREVESQVQWRRDVANGRGGEDPGVGSTEPARRAYLAVSLLTNYEATAAAGELYSRTVALGASHSYRAAEAQPVGRPDEERWIADLNAWSSAVADFINEASSDLGQ